MKVYRDYLILHFKSILQYKLSFILSFLSQIFVFFSYYFIILSLFGKFGNLQGFNLYEVLLTFSVIHFGYSMNEAFARGLDQFDHLIIEGEFDRILLRPQKILIQTLGFKIDYVKLSRVLQSIIILIYSLIKLQIKWNILKVLTLIFMLLSSCLLFFCIFLIAASYCFITVQGLEFRNLITDGGKHIAQYPMGIFNKRLLLVFTLLIPYSLVNYYPLIFLVGKTNNIVYMLLPLLVILYIIPSYLIFYRGSKKYLSTGS